MRYGQPWERPYSESPRRKERLSDYKVSRARFMCHAPECNREMRTIRDGAMGDATFTLDCGHKRSKTVPQLTPGRISLENMHTVQGLAAFPVIPVETQ